MKYLCNSHWSHFQVHCHSWKPPSPSPAASGCQHVSRQWVSEQNCLSKAVPMLTPKPYPSPKSSRGSEDLQGRMSPLRVELKLNSWGKGSTILRKMWLFLSNKSKCINMYSYEVYVSLRFGLQIIQGLMILLKWSFAVMSDSLQP